MRALTWLGVACIVVVALPVGVAAQGAGTVVGVVAGAVRTTQIWSPATPNSNSSYTGIVLGAFADAATPLSGLSVRAEGTYTRRGGDAVLSVAGQPAPGRLRMDYLTIAVHAKLSRSFGPLRVYVAAGPTVDQILRSTLDPILSQVFDQEQTPVLGVAAGGGLEIWLNDRFRLGFDARLTEGLTDAYDGAFIKVRNRSVEGLVRLAIPLSVLRGS